MLTMWAKLTKRQIALTIVLALMGMGLIAIVFVNVIQRSASWNHASESACINHLIQIDGAKQTWALETKASASAVPAWTDLKPYIGRGDGVILKCPQGGVYTIGCVTNPPTCSYPGHVLD